METIAREEAKALGLKRYFNGRSCKHGHIAERLVSNMVCCECNTLHGTTWANDNKEKSRSMWKQATKKYRAKNRHVCAEWESKRRQACLKATPAWINQEDMKSFYLEASYFGLEVDHIVPLNSPLVCGLHVEHNIQLLNSKQNKAKGNRWWPDMPDNMPIGNGCTLG